MAATSGRRQPPWELPPPTKDGPPLKLYNSLTRRHIINTILFWIFWLTSVKQSSLLSRRPKCQGVLVCLWADVSLICLSLSLSRVKRREMLRDCRVYADAHLGHARNYLTTDILRRIMKDYFKFKVSFVMNITDVDDKIILRARQQHLFERFQADHPNLDNDVLQTVVAAYEAYLIKNLPLLSSNLEPLDYKTGSKNAYGPVQTGHSLAGDGSPPGDKEAKIKMHLKAAETASDALSRAQKDTKSISSSEFYLKTEEVLVPYLDKIHGSSIDSTNYDIFNKLSRKFEDRFMEDMRALNVQDPDVVTRVTEYVPQIISYIQRIVKNGFAYQVYDSADQSSSSIYFDIGAFENAGMPYARLEPWNRNNQELQEDGEGALTAGRDTKKRSDADFALWKSSKPGEPSWQSEWGKGRPG